MPKQTSGNEGAPLPPLQLLFVDDDAADLELCLNGLKKSGLDFQAATASTREEFDRALREKAFDIVVSDYRMKDWTGLDALAIVNRVCPSIPVILLSGTLGEELAVECIKQGVTDYVLKNQLARLPVALRRAREERSLREAERKAVQALRESEERYRTLVENAPEAIVVLDVDQHKFIDCNDNALRLFRLTRGELLQYGPADLSLAIQPDGQESDQSYAAQIKRALDGGTPCFEWMHRNSQGEEIPCEIHLVGLPSPARRLVRGSILDITERKRAEMALRESEARYRGLVDNAVYGIYWVTREGKLLYVNPALVQILGYDSAQDLMDVPNTRLFYVNPFDRDALLDEYMRDGRLDSTIEWKRKEGKVITVRVNARWTRVPGQRDQCFEVMVEDVTDRIALEKQLLEAQKFEAIGQLAGGIAHDFNNMLTAIGSYAAQLFAAVPEDNPARILAVQIGRVVDQAAVTTRQLLAFSRKQILRPMHVQINPVLEEMHDLLIRLLGEQVEVTLALAADAGTVVVDPGQLQQIILNLAINSRDAMPHGGKVTLSTENVSLDAASAQREGLAPGDYVCLAVSDTGMGIDAGIRDRLFEPFFTTKDLSRNKLFSERDRGAGSRSSSRHGICRGGS